MPLLPDFKLETYFSKWEFSARYHMTASDAQSMTMAELLAMATPEQRRDHKNLWLGYSETYGNPELREIIADLYRQVKGEDILCFAGAEEGIYIAMHALLDKGDHAIVVTPNYQSAETIPLSICDVSAVALDPDDGWSLDIDAVAAAIRPNTRLISINFPHNPTGKVLERERFDALVELCREHGIWLFSDEVYRGLTVENKPLLPAAADIYERGLSLGVMSKAYGLPGLRIGWLACRDHALLSKMERMKHYLSICNAGPSESLAKIALLNADRILGRNNSLITANLVKLKALFSEFDHLFDWYTPDGGCVCFPCYKGADGVETFARDLVEQAGVLLLPASLYHSDLNQTPGDRFRIGFGRANIDEGLAAMRSYLQRNHV
ncbi:MULTISPECIES: aminotransferase class I/II-fold pyridoxal phosphate-dependent enzyme [unclassified Rhizobium]|jgi:aspartate/methionine/tyrosine aminotransferase|uniref:aminotransferase class I/II-fold pyridoxal phosphate-dependent enzyme n=1 Tax=unclassified Rhizobium TaxID=2613769 RepID=UPI000648AE8F|nr:MULTISPECIES: aminotransferase class I/II-fold pyridoxal phosphate-dependent enzyme [unclassified Rhizobium]MBN8952923.1 aminotransferase class I/II-fold pyridoxal phosphate-dependent enzyme [Rhizobium tropici]OJY76559.1 MAG: aminotransferase [Rhizobium sp. 60-20]RKD52648.1 aspartate/methionine/tyrosine aminotransferase [Rhizobium sp. WW_1]